MAADAENMYSVSLLVSFSAVKFLNEDEGCEEMRSTLFKQVYEYRLNRPLESTLTFLVFYGVSCILTSVVRLVSCVCVVTQGKCRKRERMRINHGSRLSCGDEEAKQ